MLAKLRLLFILCLCFLTCLFSACGTQAPKKAPQPAAPTEIKICSSLGKEVTELLVKDFLKQHKQEVKPKIAYLPGGLTEQRFKFITDGGFDCWLGGTAEEYYLANEQGLLQSYAAKEAFKVPAELRNRRNLWTSLYLSHIAFISNKNRLKNLGLYAPTTWDELLHPNLREEIVIPSFSLGGTSFGMLTSIWQLRGKQAALKYAAAFNNQQPLFTANYLKAADLVYQGKKALAIVPVGYALELEEKYDQLFATLPKDANRNMLTGIALLKNAPHPEITQKFIDYLMTDASEELLRQHGYQYMWHVKNYPHNNNRNKLVGDLQIPMDDLAWTSTYKFEIIRQWTEAN